MSQKDGDGKLNCSTRISIAMAAYNGERFIRDQLESLAGQTRLPDELVVSDDCSTDSTIDIVRRFAETSPFPVHLLCSESNVGCTRNYERAIGSTVGDIIFLCDCDDVWYPDKLATMEKVFEEFPDAGVALCDADLVDKELKPIGRRLWQARRFSVSRRVQRKLAEGGTFRRVPWLSVALAFRAKFKPMLLPLPETTMAASRMGAQDFLIVNIIARSGAGGIALVPEPLLAYRQHPRQLVGARDLSVLTRLALDWPSRYRNSSADFMTALATGLAATPVPSGRRHAALRQAALRHLLSRCNLPDGRLQRLSVVTRELLTLRYNRFSGGILSAGKDLFFVRSTGSSRHLVHSESADL
jgi:glycosyltransferase involved in cell wall biosynthesis